MFLFIRQELWMRLKKKSEICFSKENKRTCFMPKMSKTDDNKHFLINVCFLINLVFRVNTILIIFNTVLTSVFYYHKDKVPSINQLKSKMKLDVLEFFQWTDSSDWEQTAITHTVPSIRYHPYGTIHTVPYLFM